MWINNGGCRLQDIYCVPVIFVDFVWVIHENNCDDLEIGMHYLQQNSYFCKIECYCEIIIFNNTYLRSYTHTHTLSAKHGRNEFKRLFVLNISSILTNIIYLFYLENHMNHQRLIYYPTRTRSSRFWSRIESQETSKIPTNVQNVCNFPSIYSITVFLSQRTHLQQFQHT